MATLLSPLNYGFTNGSKPLQLEEDKAAVNYQDFAMAVGAAEETIGQIVTQHNAALIAQENTINEQNLQSLDTGTATTAQVAATVNQLITILTNLNIKPK